MSFGAAISAFMPVPWVDGHLPGSAGSVVPAGSSAELLSRLRAAASGTIIELETADFCVDFRYKHWDPADPVTVRPALGAHPRVKSAGSAVHGWYSLDIGGLRFQRAADGGEIDFSGSLNTGLKLDNCQDVDVGGVKIHDNTIMGMLCGSLGPYGSSVFTYSQRIAVWDTLAFANGVYASPPNSSSHQQLHNFYMGGNSGGLAPYGIRKLLMANILTRDAPGGSNLQLGGSVTDALVTCVTNDGASSSPYGAGSYDYCDSVQTPRSSGIRVKNSMFTNNHTYGAIGSGTSPYKATNIYDHILGFGNPLGDWYPGGIWTLQSPYWHQDPLYADRALKDFRLQSGSPAIGVGDPDYMTPTDITGAVRTTADLGAYNFNVGAPPSGGGGADTTPPVFQFAVVDSSTLALHYNEALDSAFPPTLPQYAVKVNGVTVAIGGVSITDSIVYVTLAAPVAAGDTVTVGYAL